MSAANDLEKARRFSALKILKETYDEAQSTFSKKLIYSWSEDRERKVKDLAAERNLQRQRKERQKIRQKKETEKQNRNRKRLSIIIKILVAFLLLAFITFYVVLWIF